MAYTVTKLAKLSGVSVRTLHWYDEIGLLKPAYHGANGYRYYEEDQLLVLQQILFFRELGFELKQIQNILGRSDFDQMIALKSHRQVLEKDLARTQSLIKTIDKTIKHLKGSRKMKEKEFYAGFDKKKQKEYEQQLIDRFGDKVKRHFAECENNIKTWSKKDWDSTGEEFKEICTDLTKFIEKGLKPSSKEAQVAVQRHYIWLKRFWKPTKESYAGHAQVILETDLKHAYEAYHKDLPQYIADAIVLFSAKNLI